MKPFGEPGLLLLHRLAVAYHTTPTGVLRWSPLELGLHLECLDAADAATVRRIAQINGHGEGVMPVVLLGST